MSSRKSVSLIESGKGTAISCFVANGTITPALCAVECEMTLPHGIKYINYCAQLNCYYICTLDGIYASTNGRTYAKLTSFGGANAFMVEDISEGAARAIIIVGDKALADSGSRFSSSVYGAHLRCGVMHCGRLFGADADDGLVLRWSGADGFDDWDEGLQGSGYLTLDPERGNILSVVQFGGRIVAVRERGLTLLNMYSAPENFSVGISDTYCDGIIDGTVQVVGDKLFFCTPSGIKQYDGNTIKEAEHRYAGKFSAPKCSASQGGKYFLACTSDGLGRDVVLCYDSVSGESYFIDIAADALFVADCVTTINSNGAYSLKTGGRFCYKRDNITFGTGGTKTVVCAHIGGCTDVQISNGRCVRLFRAASGTIRPRLKGNAFSVTVEGDSAVNALTVTAEVCNAI